MTITSRTSSLARVNCPAVAEEQYSEPSETQHRAVKITTVHFQGLVCQPIRLLSSGCPSSEQGLAV